MPYPLCYDAPPLESFVTLRIYYFITIRHSVFGPRTQPEKIQGLKQLIPSRIYHFFDEGENLRARLS